MHFIFIKNTFSILPVVSDGVHRADGGKQVVHVRPHVAVLHADLFRTAATLERLAVFACAQRITLAPLHEDAPEIFSGHRMFPLNFGRPFFVNGRGRSLQAMPHVSRRQTSPRNISSRGGHGRLDVQASA